ncbi:MAG: DUF1598 domain-containing protein [Planctomycetaceae bacterium]|nr:DUF1598 domain-containing protein [Planctomycetaceae bacterium]
MKTRMLRFLPMLPYVAMMFALVGTLTANIPGIRLRESGGCLVATQQQQVGGVSVDARGMLSNAKVDDTQRMREQLNRALAGIQDDRADLAPATELRKVSLRALQAALRARLESNQPIPVEMECLAGLQNIRYVFVYPERNDVVLAGFGEGFKVDDRGFVIGATTGRPVLLLDDLMVALRAAQQSNGAPFTCSIDPTKEGIERLQAFVKTLTTAGNDREALESAIENTLGSQTITVTGVPATSHLARVLVAADYRMKRIAMAFDKSPVAGLPSYMSMLSGGGRGLNNMMPRWWMTTNYEPLVHDEQKLAWELSGPGVKTMSEEDHLKADGSLQRGAQRGGLSQRWADMMSAKYGELAVKDPIFGQLRGVMDLSIVAALITAERLDKRAGLDLKTLLNDAPVVQYFTPSHVPTIAKSMSKGTSVVLSASGGVEIQPFAVVQNQTTSVEISPLREKAAPAANDRWWWN